MRRLAPLFVFVLACQTATPPPAATPLPTPPRFTPSGTAARVVLMSYDGLGADALTSFGAPGIMSMPLQARVIPAEPTSSSTTHATMITGAPPERHGVVANRFHLPGTPIGETAHGLNVTLDAETIIESARRAGKRTGSIAFPTIDGKTPRRSADWGLTYALRVTTPRVIKLKRDDFRAEWVPPTWTAPQPRRTSFSPIVRARLEWSIANKRSATDVDIVAYDTTDDAIRNYDTVAIEYDGRESQLDAKRWFSVSRRLDDGLWGSWSKVMRFDPSLNEMLLYWGPVARTEGYPESYRRMIEAEVGFWPGAPDEWAAQTWIEGRDGVDPETFAEQGERFSRFLTRATTLSIARMPFDLLLGYNPTVDIAEHQFHITLDTQWLSTPRTRAVGERVRGAAFAELDRAVSTIAGALDLTRDALIVTGDHGVGPVDTEVRLNRLLVDWGFAVVSGDRISDDTRWAAYATGNIAHFYRFKDPNDADDLVRRLTELRTPKGGPVFERVIRRTSAMHPNSGDVVAFAHPTNALSPGLNEAFVTPRYFGQHGAIASHRELHTILAATGAGVRPERIEDLQQTEIAGYVAQLLGLSGGPLPSAAQSRHTTKGPPRAAALHSAP